MVEIGGVPRAPGSSDLQQQINDLRRMVQQLAASRTYVSTENINAGGPVSADLGDQLTEVVQEKIVVRGENIGDGALDNKEIVGSSVRSEGLASAVYGDGTVRESLVSATLTQKATPWSVGAADAWPGLWLEGEPVDEPGYVPPVLPAGVTVGDSWGAVLAARSSRQTESASFGEVVVSPSSVNLNAYSAAVDAHRAQTSLGLGLGRFNLTSSDLGGVKGAEVRHDGDGVLRLVGKNGVLVNGAPIGSGPAQNDDSGWRSTSYQNGWMDYGNGFGGLQYRKLNSVLYLRGTIKGGKFYTNVTVLPEGFRPLVPAGTSAMEFPIAVTQGGTWYSGTMFAYADGTLTYYAAPGVWSGADRAIINAAFPL